MPSMASKSILKSRQRIIFILFDSEGDIEKEEVHILDQEIFNDEGEKVVKQDTKKGLLEQDAKIDIFEFELHQQYHFEEKDVDKNVEFKEINEISYNMQFSFTQFLKKQIEKARLYTVEMYEINIVC